MSFVGIMTTAVIGLLVIGFLIGLGRSWKKSLVRFGIVFVSLLLSIFISPVISRALVGNFAKGTTISIFGFSIDFKDVASNFIQKEGIIEDIFAANSTTNQLANALMMMVMNIASFLLMFISLWIIAMVVYWIVCLVLFIKVKNSDDEKPTKSWKGRFGGAFIGLATMVVICFAFLTPVFGTMNVCNEFLKQAPTTASALSPENLIAGDLYYDKDEEDEGIGSYIDKYAKIKNEYETSFIGFVFKYTGINFLGTATFNYLTEVKTEDMNVNFSEELVTIINAYNIYKETFVENEFNLKSNDSFDGVIALYKQATKSEIVKNYIEEFVPKFASRWENDDAFLGIECPIEGEMKPVFLSVMEIFETKDFNKINRNILTVLETIKIANNHDLIETVQEGKDIVEYLKTDETFVEDVVLNLSKTVELKQNLPIILNNTIELAYNKVVGGTETFEGNQLTNQQIAAIDWNNEASLLQQLVLKTLVLLDNIEGDSTVLLNQLTNVGEVIDIARESAMLSKPLQTFIKGFVNSDKFKLDSKIKTTVSSYIDSKWDPETNKDYKFVQLFAVVQDMANVADDISKNKDDINLSDITGALSTIIDNQEIKDTVQSIIEDKVIEELVGSDNQETADVVKDMLNTFMENTKASTIEKDIAAGQEIINILNDSQNNDNKVYLGETQEEKEAEAERIILTMVESEAIMAMIEKANSENTTLKDITTNLGGDVSYIQDNLLTNTEISDTQRMALLQLFG